jgi:hypothetical protein
MVLDIGSEAIRTKDAQELRPQKLIQHFGTAALGNGEKCEAMRYENPKPEFHTIVAPSRFISIEDRVVWKLLFKLMIAGLQSCTGFF